MTQIVKSPAMRQAEGIIALAGDKGAIKAELDRIEEGRAEIAREMHELNALRAEQAKSEQELADSFAVLQEERRLLDEDKETFDTEISAHAEAKDALDAQREQQAETQRAQTAQHADLQRRETGLSAGEKALDKEREALLEDKRQWRERIAAVTTSYEAEY